MPTLVNGGVSIPGGVTLNGGAGASVNAPVSDSFLDDLYVHGLQNLSSTSNGTLPLNSPTKYVSNPLGLANASSWDAFPYYGAIIDDASGTYKVYYSSPDSPAGTTLLVGYATTTDGLAFTKPNLGLVTFGGNTNNNILLGNPAFHPSAYYDASGAAGQKYLMLLGGAPGVSGNAVKLYGGDTPASLSVVKDLSGKYGQADAWEACAIVKRPDGRWLAYAQTHWSDLRCIGALLSDTTSLTGTWTSLGDVILGTTYTDQLYQSAHFYLDGLYFALIGKYNSTSAHISPIALYTSRDGQAWTLRTASFIAASGSSSAFDFGMLFPYSSPPLHVGNEWWFYYGATKDLHNASSFTLSDVGLAKIGYQRIGQVSSTGALITVPIVTSTGPYALTVNANGTGGSVKVRVTDTNGNALSGYTYADMDTPITTDTYGATVTWGGGNPVPANATFRLNFLLTSGFLYHYTIQ